MQKKWEKQVLKVSNFVINYVIHTDGTNKDEVHDKIIF